MLCYLTNLADYISYLCNVLYSYFACKKEKIEFNETELARLNSIINYYREEKKKSR